MRSTILPIAQWEAMVDWEVGMMRRYIIGELLIQSSMLPNLKLTIAQVLAAQ
jgi:hypothetical protein